VIAAAEIEEYAAAHTTAPGRDLTVLAQETRAMLEDSQMLSGPVEGRLLELLVHGVQARLVLEIGTFSGFSAISMAAGLPAGGRVITCEIASEHADFAQRHIAASQFGDRIELRRGPALETIADLDGPFDLVFIDADKTGYAGYYEAVLPKLSAHGLIVVDNTLWSGRVLDAQATDASTVALAEFNRRLAADPRVVCVMLTVRDGVTLIRHRAEEFGRRP
jgi:caffeoyl-CoA O-methyltransferase